MFNLVRQEALTLARHSILLYRSDNAQLGYSREIANLLKIYTDEDQYSGHPDNSFDYKFGIFLDKYSKAGILIDA
jgi:hypothetical protein